MEPIDEKVTIASKSLTGLGIYLIRRGQSLFIQYDSAIEGEELLEVQVDIFDGIIRCLRDNSVEAINKLL